MADNQNTPPNDQAGTGDGNTPPAATQTPPNDQAGASGDDEVITLKKSDYNNLVSQRDKANNSASATEAYVMQMAKKEEISDWLKEKQSEFPDVSIDDLMAAESEAELPKIAARTQRRIEDAVQAKLKTVQRASVPTLSPEDKAAKLAALSGKDRPDDAFEQFVGLQMTPTTK
jgi:hypothetical protein